MVNNNMNTFYKINPSENNFNIFRIIRENEKLLEPISLNNNLISQYALILGYYPMSQSKFKIFIKLNKNEKLGMLNRYILGISSKLGVYQSFLKQFNDLRLKHKKLKKNIKKEKKYEDFWQKSYAENQLQMTKQYNMLIDIILEETSRRNNSKYLRKKKLQEIKDNLQN